MAFSILTRPAAILCLATAVTFAGRSALAAVPESVAVRQQSPDVEQIISQLEAKAAGATGTWTTKSARKDMPAEEWTTGISGNGKNGGSWYWKSEAKSPSLNEGLVLFNNGEDAYVLPYGKDNQLGGLRFQYDTLRSWPVGDYQMGYYLLHMNLLPRQFINGLGAVSLIGTETLEGVQVTHLRADPKLDKSSQHPSNLQRRMTTHDAVFDLYYDPQKRAIIKLTATFPGLIRKDSQVTSWDDFGTSYQWPSKIEGRKVTLPPLIPAALMDVWNLLNYADDASTLRENNSMENIFLMTVGKFTAGNIDLFEASNKQIEATGIFFTPPEALRNVSFYKQALVTQDNVNDLAALIEAHFLAGEVAEGLEEWGKLEAETAAPQAKMRFTQAIAPLAANCLREASFGKQKQEACVILLKQLTERLDDQYFDQVALNLITVWNQLRTIPQTRAAVTSLTPALLPRVIHCRNILAQAALVNCAESHADNAILINPQIDIAFNNPVPKTGLEKSQQDFILLGAVRAHAFARAQRLLNAVQWDAAAATQQKQFVGTWASVVQAANSLQKGTDAVDGAVKAYGACAKWGTESVDRIYAQQVLVDTSAAFVIGVDVQRSKRASLDLIKQNMSLAGADQYWSAVVTKASNDLLLDPSSLTAKISPLIHGVAETFRQSNFESSLWLQLAYDPRIRGQFLGLELEYANKALATATDDKMRTKVILMIGRIYAASREYKNGAQAIVGAREWVTDQTQIRQINEMVNRLNTISMEWDTSRALSGTSP